MVLNYILVGCPWVKIESQAVRDRYVYRSFFFSDNCMKQIDSMLPGVCSVIDHWERQNVVKTSVTHSPAARVPRLTTFTHHVICDLLLYRREWQLNDATGNLFSLLCSTWRGRFWKCLLDYFGLSKQKPREKSRGLKRAWDTCGKTSVRKWQLLYCLFYVVHKLPILQFFKTRTVKNLHGTTNRFTSKMELGDDHWQFSFKTTTYCWVIMQ